MKSSKVVILITGASGFIGSYVAEAALKRGYDVRTLTRRDWLGGPPVVVENRLLGVFPFNLPSQAFEGVYAIVHLANTTGAEDVATARVVNVEGTRHLLRLAQQHGVHKIVYISSQSAKEHAISAYGKTKFEAEKLLLDSSPPVTIIRPGLVYGAGKRGLFTRMALGVQRTPVVPLIGGGRALVQPIHVEDLAVAILRCLDTGAFDGQVLKLGDPNAVILAEFLQMIAKTQTGRRKLTISIPIDPLLKIVSMFESIGITLPISTNNLQGLKHIERMDSESDLRGLGLRLRPLEQGLKEVKHSAQDSRWRGSKNNLDTRALRVVLIGAGRIGMVHAITIEHQRGMRLSAIIDKNPRPINLLRGMGIDVPAYRSLADAIEAQELDAAVIATPPSSHMALVKDCIKAGLSVLVEKPLAISHTQLLQFNQLAKGHHIQVGYFAPSYPHFRAAMELLRAGHFGKVLSFEGFSLQSLFPGSNRWEVNPEISGGGVLINLGGHVLSMIYAAFGAPQSINAEHKKLYNRNVEDSMIVHFNYGGFSGRLHASWAITGFPQAENRLVISTDSGSLICNNKVAAFIKRDGSLEKLHHQLDYDIGFNFLPDYIGGGITSEWNQFQDRIRKQVEPIMKLKSAIDLERNLFSIYETSKETARFSSTAETPTQSTTNRPNPLSASSNTHERDVFSTSLILDIRQINTAELVTSKAFNPQAPWHGYQILANQVKPFNRAGFSFGKMNVVVPDFMNYARLLNAGRATELLRNIGVKSSVSLVLQAMKSVISNLGLNFWAIVDGLVAADLSLIPREYGGTVLIHNFLTDLAVSLDRATQLDFMVRLIQARLKSARVGFQTNILSETINTLVYVKQPIQALHFLSSPCAHDLKTAVAQLRSSPHFSSCHLAAEPGLLPVWLYSAVVKSPEAWTHGAESLVINAVCDPELAQLRRESLVKAWGDAFPGLQFPEGAL